MVALAAKEAAAGIPAAEIILKLSKYYLSFRESRKSFRPDDRMCLGSKDAKVTLVEFSDFECPHCAAARPILEKFARDNPSTARLCFAPFPLAGHSNAEPAARAALLARDKGKFWELHDLLFENQARLNQEVIRTLAAKVNLASNELSKTVDSPRYAAELQEWKEAGRKAGVDSTPTLYVNGRKLNLALTADTLERTLQDEMEWISNRGRWAPD
jgi:protein-disulfide isomerase